jgi:hypothetical protein
MTLFDMPDAVGTGILGFVTFDIFSAPFSTGAAHILLYTTISVSIPITTLAFYKAYGGVDV